MPRLYGCKPRPEWIIPLIIGLGFPAATVGVQRNSRPTGRYQRVLLEGVGHFPAREAPDDVAKAALDHLKSVV
jgi:pimeloyl-ACP methyl ester carboxylesterase